MLSALKHDTEIRDLHDIGDFGELKKNTLILHVGGRQIARSKDPRGIPRGFSNNILVIFVKYDLCVL